VSSQDPTASEQSPDRQSNDRRGSRGGSRGRGRGRIDPRQMSPEPTDQRPEEDRQSDNGERPIPTGPAADEKPPRDAEMPPPSRPASQGDQQAQSLSTSGPFKKVVGTQNPPRAPAADSKATPFRFTMALPPKQPKAAKPVPKALDAHMKPAPKFATGSNSAPLGRTIDLSTRLSRVHQPEPRKSARDSRRDRDRERDRQRERDMHRRSPVRSPAPPPLAHPAPPPPGPEIIVKDMPIYHRVSMVGEGTYGKVYKASNNLTKELVALKRIRMENEKDGFPITAVREMRLLQALKHENIVSLLEMMVEKSKCCLVVTLNIYMADNN
jgi:CTD kinase subunit alpha